MSFANVNIFASFFPIWMPFIYSSCLNDMAKSSSTMMNMSGESGPPGLVCNFKGNAFSFCLLSMI